MVTQMLGVLVGWRLISPLQSKGRPMTVDDIRLCLVTRDTQGFAQG
jgi:hypothetical protein